MATRTIGTEPDFLCYISSILQASKKAAHPMSQTAAHFDSLFSLKGKTALVTGGGSGLGLMITQALVASGARVYIASRSLETCQSAAESLAGLAGECVALGGDVSTEQGVHDIVELISAREPALNILVNNAGRTWGAPMGQYPWQAWSEIMDLNVTGLFTLTRELLALLKQAGTPADPARVINMGSIMGTMPHGFPAYAYSASKAAVHHMTRFFANELAGQHITVNAIAPGPFPSRMTAFFTEKPELSEAVERAVPLGRLGQHEDIAGLIACLCGAGGAYITGAVIPLDGGMSVFRTPGLEQGLG
jgi:NAD(P)-dependent dehydrogenase (short-subunit alcohol dehydrogenase family)